MIEDVRRGVRGGELGPSEFWLEERCGERDGGLEKRMLGVELWRSMRSLIVARSSASSW